MLNPKKMDSAIVGTGLIAFGIFYLLKSGFVEYQLSAWIMKYGSWIIPILFLLLSIENGSTLYLQDRFTPDNLGNHS